jgi:glycosyltransferase involved in cell wall biosynthesis
MIQSNADLDERYLSHPDARSAYGEVGADCVLALRNASLVVCQTELQREMLQNRFGIEGTVLPNAIDLEPWISARDRRSKLPRSSEAKQVLWIGRYDRFHKRPMLCLEIARKCPAIQFRMIINGSDPTIEAEIHRDKPNNVSIVAYVPFDQMARTMSEADVLLFTGSRAYEGFPNVLLQAAATGCPIVSLEDFDGFLSKSEAGIVCGGDLEIASLAIQEYASGACTVDVERVRDYLAMHHGHTAIARKFRTLLHPPNLRP